MTDKTILVVEDDTTLSRSLQEILTKEGFSVVTAIDGESALALVRAHHPSLILLDLILSGMGGLEMLKALRADASIASTPVMILSNQDEIDTVSETLKGGVFDYLVKHEWRIEDVVTRIKERLGMTK